MYTNQAVSVDMRIVGKLVLVDLHGSGDALQLALNDLANRFELLIEAAALKWSKADKAATASVMSRARACSCSVSESAWVR